MKILITGSAGYIGTLLCRVLQKTHEIIPFDLVKGQDIHDVDYFKEVMLKNNVDTVIHLAALRSVDLCERNAIKGIQANLTAAITLYELCHCHSVKFIFASTFAIDQHAEHNYALCKKIAEQNMPYAVIVRLSNVVGAYSGYLAHEYPNLTENIISAIKQDQTLILNGNCVRNFVFIHDVVEAFIDALEAQAGIYRCTGAIHTNMEHWIQSFEQYFCIKLDVQRYAKKEHDAQANTDIQFDDEYFQKIAASYEEYQ